MFYVGSAVYSLGGERRSYTLFECNRNEDTPDYFYPKKRDGVPFYKLRIGNPKDPVDRYVWYDRDVTVHIGKEIYFDDDNVLVMGSRK